MTNSPINIQKIKETISNNPYLTQHLRQHLEAIIVLDLSYLHIVQLEVLVNLMKDGLSNYYQEYHPELHFITKQAGLLGQVTKDNHYLTHGKEPNLDAHQLYIDIFGTEFHDRIETKRKPILKK